ncbi:MAG TPA: hypothetical protein VL284_03250 [Thermoanaerobaculia bacterium]|nr:hypothetical protein [Thermoanaerobaculia bacterium]
MRKLTVLAMLAAVLIAAPMFAVQRHLTPAPNATFAFGVGGAAFGPTTTNNDDSCDIGNAPAATLLLPYFDVDIKSPQTTARTTLFTITNVSAEPQIAHVVIWTDWSFPVMDFNIFLTGYDVQAINLYDILERGVIAPTSGTSSLTDVPVNPTPGSTPFSNIAGTSVGVNPNLDPTLAGCTNLPGAIPPGLLTDAQLMLTTGVGSGAGNACTSRVGGTHNDAIGYITVDVNANCNTTLPTTPSYYTANLLFDNVLIGDYENVQPNTATANAAGGANMVSIRAVPEGGFAGSVLTPPTNLPFTFYDRYTTTLADRRTDRRQPLPATFAARYINAGTGSFNTNYQIWREGTVVNACTTATSTPNSSIAFTEFVKFDEHENANIAGGGVIISPAPPGSGLPETSSTPVSGAVFPAQPSAAGDVAGWTYLNLDNNQATTAVAGYSRDNVAGARRPSQNWVTVNMQAESRFSVLFDANWLGNGCSAQVPAGAQIGPSGGIFVCPPPLAPGAGCASSPIGTNITPP